MQETSQSLETYRKIGKPLLNSTDPMQRSAGTSNILKAYSSGDPEATYNVGDLMPCGVLNPATGDPEEWAPSILCSAAQKGNIQARALLKPIRISTSEVKTGPLVDFDGKSIKSKRTFERQY